MCGICGVYNYRSNEPVKESLIRSMAAQIVHRGPDDDGFYSSGAIGLGMRRLSIIDLDGGHQPMSNEDDSVWIVFNGEIYNFMDLRGELETRGHVFRTRSDTEVIIHSYEEWGPESFAKLNGMFGLALWDAHRRELLLARDPFGIKPLYYADMGGRLLFGSEIKAILADVTVPREMDEMALDQYLTFSFVPSPQTLFRGIRKLPPGFLLRVNDKGADLQRFYCVRPVLEFRTEADWLNQLRGEIEEAVHRQMVADVLVGVMLSGGVDSATVATLMQRFAGRPVHTFTVGFGERFAQDELTIARRSAEIIGSEHHEAVISAEEYADFLPDSLWYLEEPVATTSALAFYWICKLARQYVKVVLTGQGADEPFAGYGRHIGEYYGGWYRHLPSFLRDGLATPVVERLPRNDRLRRAVHSLGIQDPLERFTQIYSVFDPAWKRRLYRDGSGVRQDHIAEAAVALWQQDVQGLDGLSQMLYIDARFSLPDNLLLYGDKMAMATSLEARVPFLDLKLMSLFESMPPSMKIRGRTQKYLLKKAMSAWIPQEIIRRRKIGFATPIDEWFANSLRSYVGDQLLASDSACRTYFEPATIRSMIQEHGDGRRDYKRHLFSLLTFELWHKQFIA